MDQSDEQLMANLKVFSKCSECWALKKDHDDEILWNIILLWD